MSFEGRSRSTRIAAQVIGAILVLATAGLGYYACVIDTPERRAEQAFDAAIADATKLEAEAALRRLDAMLASDQRSYVKPETEARVGAAIVRITASLVPQPFTRTHLDQAGRLVRRYHGLPPRARDGVSRDTLLATLDRWIESLGTPEDQEARLALLRHAASATDARRSAGYSQRIAATRALVGAAKAERAPLDALAILLDEPRDEACLAKAQQIMARLVESPSLLADAEAEVELWLASRPADQELRQRIEAQLAAGRAARTEAESADAAALAKLVEQRPWDQHAATKLALGELEAGNMRAAEERLRKLGPPELLIRNARQALAGIVMAQDRLEEADALLTEMIESRLGPFREASEALERAALALQHGLDEQLRSGAIPDDLAAKLQNASEAEQRELILQHFNRLLETDPAVKQARSVLERYHDVVPMSITAGTVKIRRAQGLAGAARDSMLADAERIFLAIRAQAEGQPAFHLGLGEVNARLGKMKESEAELQRVLDMKDPQLSLDVAHVYRALGSEDRAKQVARSVFDSAASPVKESAAYLLALLHPIEDEEAEKWLRAADTRKPMVKTALLEIEARRLLLEGKHAECDRKYTEIVKAHLAEASPKNIAGYNNAALAQQARFYCTGDLGALREAEATLDQAYRAAGDQSIVVHNLASMLDLNVSLRVLAKRIDVRALRLKPAEATTLIDALLDSDERDGVLADLKRDPAWRRAGTLLAHAEVLAPNRVDSYDDQYERAVKLRDVAAASAVIDRMKAAKALDTSAAEKLWKDWVDGKDPLKLEQAHRVDTARYAELLGNPKLEARTRAAALLLDAVLRHRYGLYKSDAAAVEKAASAYEQATKLWPALRHSSVHTALALDVAGLRADATKWAAARRERSAPAVLERLSAAKDPLAAKLTSSPQWATIATSLKEYGGTPTVDSLRLARLLGDAALEARMKAVLDDKLARLSLERLAIGVPSMTSSREDLAYLDKR